MNKSIKQQYKDESGQKWRQELTPNPREKPRNCPYCKKKVHENTCTFWHKTGVGTRPVKEFQCSKCGYTREYAPRVLVWVKVPEDDDSSQDAEESDDDGTKS
jgi:Zn ribbon nucleic-acid-binding protein